MTSPVFADVYELDLNGKPDLAAFVKAGMPWAGLGMKATEGLYYPKDPTWFHGIWPAARTAAGARYGRTFFRYAYHYFIVGEDPVKQADFFLGLVDSAGGWGEGDLRPVVDVETAEQPQASAQQVIDAVSAFSARIKDRHGCEPILYAGSYIRDLGITDHLGCAYLITAAYGSTLSSHLYTSMGWTLAELLGWQYQGTDRFSGPQGYPRICPLADRPDQPVDLSAVTIIDGATPDEQLAWIRSDIASY